MSDLRAFRETQARAALSGQDGPLPCHAPECFGCGPDSVRGLHLQVRRQGAEVLSEIVFQPWAQGAPGIVHGGLVSAVCDDFLGFGLYLSPRTAVTRALQVEFHSPALPGVRYALRGWVQEAHPHKAWFAGEGTEPGGAVVFSARGLFVDVRRSHFDRPGITP